MVERDEDEMSWEGADDPSVSPFLVDLGYSSIGNPGTSAWAARIMQADGTSRVITAVVTQSTTSAAISLMGFIGVLKALPEGAVGTVRSRDKTAIQSIHSYLSRWEANGWKGSNKKAVANVQLWRLFAALKGKFPELAFEWAETPNDLLSDMETMAEGLARGAVATARAFGEGQGKL